MFQATAFHYPPRTVMKEDQAGNSIAIGGYEYLIFDTISKKLKWGKLYVSKVAGTQLEFFQFDFKNHIKHFDGTRVQLQVVKKSF